jgi:uncharacterized protein
MAILLFTICAIRSSTVSAQSFDCSKARTAVEKAICADVALGALDNELASAFKEAMAAVTVRAEHQGLLVDERYWLSHRDHWCPAPIANSCVDRAYRMRIAGVRDYAVNTVAQAKLAFAALPTLDQHSLVRLYGGWKFEGFGPPMADGYTFFITPTYLTADALPDAAYPTSGASIDCFFRYQYRVEKIERQDVSQFFREADGEWHVYITADNPKLFKGGPDCQGARVRIPTLFVRIDVPESDPTYPIGEIVWNQCDSAERFERLLNSGLPEQTESCYTQLRSQTN